MEFDPQDQDIVKLLTKLKNSEGPYPEHMFVTRRQMYLKRMTEIGLGIGAGTGIEEAAKNTPGPSAGPAVSATTSTLLETALIAAIILEASAVAYFYRDRLSDFFKTITTESRVQQVTPVPVLSTEVEVQGGTVTTAPAITATVPLATLSPGPTGSPIVATRTPIPGVADDTNSGDTTTNNGAVGNDATGASSNVNNGGATAGAGSGQTDSTPVPDANSETDKDNQGNHYGQTPKPERTKENSGNNNQPPQNSDSIDQQAPANSNDPPPAENDTTPAKDEPKPTKSK
jgi:hypothetical protein